MISVFLKFLNPWLGCPIKDNELISLYIYFFTISYVAYKRHWTSQTLRGLNQI